jgi:hypothetical protein
MISIALGSASPGTDLDLKDAGGGLERAAGPGLYAAGQFLYFVTPRWGLGVDVGGARFGDSEVELPKALTRSGASLVTFQSLGRFNLRPDGLFNPYMVGGIGVGYFTANVYAKPKGNNTWQSITATDTPSREERLIVDGGSTGLSASLGGGLEIVGKRVIFGLEARWFYNAINRQRFGTDSFNCAAGYVRLGLKFNPIASRRPVSNFR